jgi:hypothetical protein
MRQQRSSSRVCPVHTSHPPHLHHGGKFVVKKLFVRTSVFGEQICNMLLLQLPFTQVHVGMHRCPATWQMHIRVQHFDCREHLQGIISTNVIKIMNVLHFLQLNVLKKHVNFWSLKN